MNINTHYLYVFEYKYSLLLIHKFYLVHSVYQVFFLHTDDNTGKNNSCNRGVRDTKKKLKVNGMSYSDKYYGIKIRQSKRIWNTE